MNSTTLDGPVDFRHSFLKMRDLNVSVDGKIEKLCGSAMGYAFAAGTTDGPGQFDFTQGTNSTNPFWKLVGGLLSKPTPEDIACHAPKPILLNLNDMTVPYRWEPPVLPIQVMRVGQLFILAVPSEFTTMSGRRMRKAIKQILQNNGVKPGEEVFVTIAGLANSYSHYVTTHEEYQEQRYEAASTLYGPNTLQAYIQEVSRITTDMLAGRPSTSADAPPDDSKHQISFITPVLFDMCPIGKHFGDVRQEATGPYEAGSAVVEVVFQSADPRNNLRTQDTYLTVERQVSSTAWQIVARDGDWETKFHWSKDGADTGLNAASKATIEWDIPTNTPAGTYRIFHFGDYKELTSKIKPFQGCSKPFEVTAARYEYTERRIRRGGRMLSELPEIHV